MEGSPLSFLTDLQVSAVNALFLKHHNNRKDAMTIKDQEYWDKEQKKLRSENFLHRKNLDSLKANDKDIFSGHESDPSNVTFFDLNDVVRGVIALIGPKLKDRGKLRGVSYNLKTFLRSESPLRGNPEEIRVVVTNMIMNAVGAMPEGGHIYLTTEENEDFAFIYVQDSGEGIEEHINGRILDPFPITEGEGGIGLGRSLAYAVVKRHRGDMDVKSRKGKGTIVTIRLPIEREKLEVRGSTRRVKMRNAKILIIEAHHIFGELLRQVLWSKGCRAEMAVSPLEGLNRLRRRRFDLLIAGTAVAEAKMKFFVKRAKKIDGSLPVVLIVSRDGNEKPARFKGTDADLVIKKPLEMEHFAGQISDILNRNQKHP